MIWLELNAKIEPFDNVERAAGDELRLSAGSKCSRRCSRGSPTRSTAACPTSIRASPTSFCTYNYDLDKAKELLARRGLGGGFKTTLAYNAGDPVQEPIAIIYQTALREVGVELELKKVPAGSFYNAVTERKQPMIFYVDSPWCPDPGYSLTLYFDQQVAT